jgi:hypothetical protein
VGYTIDQVKDTAHCLYWSKEGKDEFFYFTENVSTNKEGPTLGKRVYKTDLHGKILYVIGNVEKEGSTSQKFDWTSPTDVAVSANGDIYVVDGYGSQRVSRFDRNFMHLKTIKRDQRRRRAKRTPRHFQHLPLTLDQHLKSEPEVFIADRNNGRIEVYSWNWNTNAPSRVMWNPCVSISIRKTFIPDLGGKVTILDPDGKPVVHLGDGYDAAASPGGQQNQSRPFPGHTPCALIPRRRRVVEWLNFGRPRFGQCKA